MTNDNDDDDARLAAADRVTAMIRTVLLERWDPLGVHHPGACSAHYDACIPRLYRMLASGDGPLRLAAELAEAERRMGRTTSPRALLPVARALRQLDVRLEPDTHR